MFTRRFAYFCVIMFVVYDFGFSFTEGAREDDESEDAEELVAPKEEYQSVLENLPLLYTHVVDVLQDNPEVLERNDVRMKRNAKAPDFIYTETEDVNVWITIMENTVNNDFFVLSENNPGEDCIQSKVDKDRSRNKNERPTKSDMIPKEIDEKRHENHKKVGNIDETDLVRTKRNIEGFKLTREEVENLYDLVEKEIEKHSKHND